MLDPAMFRCNPKRLIQLTVAAADVLAPHVSSGRLHVACLRNLSTKATQGPENTKHGTQTLQDIEYFDILDKHAAISSSVAPADNAAAIAAT